LQYKGNLNQKNWRRVFLLSAVFFIGLLFVACKKKNSDIGKDNLNPDDLLNSAQIDTFELHTFSIEEDSVITDNPAYGVLGSYNDPKFGTVNTNFYTQFRLSGVDPDFGDLSTIIIDSMMLGLEYAGYTGDLSAQNIEVYELSENLYIDSTYYTFSTATTYSENLVQPGYGTITPNPDGTTIIGSDTVDTQMRIRLKNVFAKKFIVEANSGGTNFSSNENFLNYFKGLHVKVNNGNQPSGKGGVFYFNLNDPLSKMTIYYTQSGINKTFDFLINSECADFNHVEINNTGTQVQNVLNDTVSGVNEFYAQSFKIRAAVDMPGLKGVPTNAIIHKAELLLPIQYQLGSNYAPSDELSVTAKLEDGGLAGIGTTGVFDFFNRQYTVDIRNYVQAYVSGLYDNTTLYLSPRFFINSAERVVFNGQQTINKMKPKLVITYTAF
jgi:hypothetical protein